MCKIVTSNTVETIANLWDPENWLDTVLFPVPIWFFFKYLYDFYDFYLIHQLRLNTGSTIYNNYLDYKSI